MPIVRAIGLARQQALLSSLRVFAHGRPRFRAHRWTANVRILEIDKIKTVPHVPLSHSFVERLIGRT